MGGSRQRSQLRRPTWIIVSVSVVSVFLIAAYNYTPQSPSTCSFFSSNGCGTFDPPPAVHSRELTDAEIESRVVINEILKYYPVQTKVPKVAFLFLTPGSLPFEKLWHMFFQGHEGKFSVYIHASKEKTVHVSPYFVGRDIHSEPVAWGRISMVEAERRLLANALLDPDNQHFVLLSESCIPVRRFDFVYHYLLLTNVSFIDSYVDPGPHGNGRYIEHMLPEVEKKDFRKGSQWFSMKRQHALIILADSLYFTKFKHHCRIWYLNCFLTMLFLTIVGMKGICKIASLTKFYCSCFKLISQIWRETATAMLMSITCQPFLICLIQVESPIGR